MPGELRPEGSPPRRVLVVGCGALGRELVALTRNLPGVDLTCLPAELHNRPERIPEAVAGRLRARGGDYDRVFVAYADCGTGGLLDRMLETEFEGVERIPGAHCYEFYAGAAAFATMQDEEAGTFYLTDFLARNFERIVWRGLGLADHPELLETYFGNYRRLVYLAQTEDADLVERARTAADRLGLAFEHRQTGLGDLAMFIGSAASAITRTEPGTGDRPASLTTGISLRALPRVRSGDKKSAPRHRPSAKRHEARGITLAAIRDDAATAGQP
jgi:hypothetical protein